METIFKIEDGILLKVKNTVVDVVIPDSVTSIGERAFIFECDSEDEDLIETLSGIYDANANPDLRQFNAKEFLKSNTPNYSNLKKIIENYKDSSNGSTESANELFISALCDWCQNDDLFKELYNIITDNLYNDAFPKALQYIINNKKQ